MMQLHWFKAQAPLRVLALIKHLGIEVELVEIDMAKGGLRAQDYTALNPNKKAPTLVDGELVLWESAAIMAYLAMQAGSDMWPTDNPRDQAEVLRWLTWNEGHWVRAVGVNYVEYIIKPQFNMGPPDTAAIDANTGNFMKFAKVLDAHLNGRDYLAANRLTIADFALASMARYWRETKLPMENFPNIIRWLDTLMTLPAWADPWPERRAA
ncbi:glutathione S-transferase family protein [Sneathiella sp.]|uniref:glutathione S-transferase family protein n=1 Tax=Sneathiella sp. TaxID=1964365 RepID=UPI002FE10D7F